MTAPAERDREREGERWRETEREREGEKWRETERDLVYLGECLVRAGVVALVQHHVVNKPGGYTSKQSLARNGNKRERDWHNNLTSN